MSVITVAKPAIPVLLRMAVIPADDDPRKVLQHDIARALFYNGRAQPRKGLLPKHGLEGVDRRLLVPAIREILTNKNGWARSTMANFIYPLLTEAERKQLWGDIHQATKHIAPSGIMFADGVRYNGLMLMQANNITEGIDLTSDYMQENRWGRGGREIGGVQVLDGYGSAAKKTLPMLLELQKVWSKKNGYEKHLVKLNAAIKAIETGVIKEMKSIKKHILPKK